MVQIVEAQITFTYIMFIGLFLSQAWATRRCRLQIDLGTLRALGWGEPPQIKFLYTNPPRGATFVCWPRPNCQSIYPHLVGWSLWAPGLGEPPTNKILHGKPTPRSSFCLLAPAQFFTLQGISDGVTIRGTPGGQNFWLPLARCGAWVK